MIVLYFVGVAACYRCKSVDLLLAGARQHCAPSPLWRVKQKVEYTSHIAPAGNLHPVAAVLDKRLKSHRIGRFIDALVDRRIVVGKTTVLAPQDRPQSKLILPPPLTDKIAPEAYPLGRHIREIGPPVFVPGEGILERHALVNQTTADRAGDAFLDRLVAIDELLRLPRLPPDDLRCGECVSHPHTSRATRSTLSAAFPSHSFSFFGHPHALTV